MGQLTVIRQEKAANRLDRLDRTLVEQGFASELRKDFGGWTILLHKKLNGETTPPLIIDDRNFALHTGSFFYGQNTGEEALRAVHRDFDSKDFNWSKCRGHFGLLICKDGQLFVCNDGLGSYHLFHDPEFKIVSSSFVAVAELGAKGALDKQGVYEYAWNGATFGTKTFFSNVKRVAHASLVHMADVAQLKQLDDPVDIGSASDELSLTSIAQQETAKLSALFATYKPNFRGPVRTALSGGYDSRLILALLLQGEITPDLFVYGDAESLDVKVAKTIAEGEKLPLAHIIKSEVEPPSPDGFPESCERNLYAFDGWKNGGLFDNSADYADRRARSDSRSTVLNGSVGEIFRNFFYLPDRSMTVRDVIWSFFSRYAPSSMTPVFSQDEYEAELGNDIRAVLDTDQDSLSRAQVEAIYPLFRGRYWTARDTTINQRFGWMLFPYMEPSVVDRTPSIPISYKNFGRLEAKMITVINERLAGYPNVYGVNFTAAPTLKYRAKMLGSIIRPPSFRRLAYRLQHRQTPNLPLFLQPHYLGTIMDASMPYMRHYFHPEKIRDTDVFNRVATMEYLCQRYSVG